MFDCPNCLSIDTDVVDIDCVVAAIRFNSRYTMCQLCRTGVVHTHSVCNDCGFIILIGDFDFSNTFEQPARKLAGDPMMRRILGLTPV